MTTILLHTCTYNLTCMNSCPILFTTATYITSLFVVIRGKGEREEETAGMRITARKGKGKAGRQAKITALGTLSAAATAAVTKPSPFGKINPPIIPEFCVEKPKKKPGKAPKKEEQDPAQTKLEFTGADGMEVAKKTVKETKKRDPRKTTKKTNPLESGDDTPVITTQEKSSPV